MWQGQVFFNKARPSAQAAIVDALATRDAQHLYLHLLNTDYAREHRVAVSFANLPVSGGIATIHRLRFLTKSEVAADGSWTIMESENLPLAAANLTVPLPCRSATIVVVPLQDNILRPCGSRPD